MCRTRSTARPIAPITELRPAFGPSELQNMHSFCYILPLQPAPTPTVPVMSSHPRAGVARDIATRPVRPSDDGNGRPGRVSEYFGINSFGLRQMRDKLPKDVYRRLRA